MNELKLSIKNAISGVVTIITDWSKSSHQKHLQTQKQLQEQQQHAYFINMLYEIQAELFFVMNGSYYKPLRPIITVKNIRVQKYFFRKHVVIFVFSLTLNTDEIISKTILDIIKENINKDIAQLRNELIRTYGYEQACLLHPYIICGLSVIDIHQDGTEIFIDVVTDYFP